MDQPTDDHMMQLVLPRTYREQVMRQLHDNPTSGHFAFNKTLCRVRQRFYWVGHTRDVKLSSAPCVHHTKGLHKDHGNHFRLTTLEPRWKGSQSTFSDLSLKLTMATSISSLPWITSPSGRRHTITKSGSNHCG